MWKFASGFYMPMKLIDVIPSISNKLPHLCTKSSLSHNSCKIKAEGCVCLSILSFTVIDVKQFRLYYALVSWSTAISLSRMLKANIKLQSLHTQETICLIFSLRKY